MLEAIKNYFAGAEIASAIYTPKTEYKGTLPKGVVSMGSVGTDAKAVQTFLNWAINAGLAVDGVAGVKTVAAIKKYQKQYKLAIDGIFGAKSKAKAQTIIKAHKPEAKKGVEEKIADACKAQTEWAYKSKYDWQSSPTVPKSKTTGTCVTYVACVFQRLKVFPSGKYIWHNGKGYGTGKAYGQTDKFKITYYNNKKSLKDIKATLKAGDVIMYDDNKSGRAGAGGHIEIYTGSGYKFYSGGLGSGHNTSNSHGEKESRKVLCVCRVKDGLIK